MDLESVRGPSKRSMDYRYTKVKNAYTIGKKLPTDVKVTATPGPGSYATPTHFDMYKTFSSNLHKKNGPYQTISDNLSTDLSQFNNTSYISTKSSTFGN